MIKLNLQFFGGRGSGSGSELSDGPQGGGSGKGKTQWGQPHTPLVVPAPTIAMQIGEKGRPIPADKAVKSINPDRTMEYGDYSENCQRCVIAYELNRRGYNVEASESFEKDPYPRGNKWLDAFKGGKLTVVGATTNDKVNKNITAEMQKWGNGSRGIVKIAYTGGGAGHVFNVEYSGGKLKYYDAQTGDRYDPKRVFAHVNKKTVQIVRTDNLQLNDDVRNMVRKKRRSSL